MLAEGECKINGLRLTELTYENTTGTPSVLITYALTQVEPESKKVIHTHGKVTATGGNLSISTLEILKQLIEQIEQDLAPRHFTQETKKEQQDESRITTAGSEEVEQL